METPTAPDRDQPNDRTTKVIVPLIGTAAAVFAAVLSSFLVWFTNDRTSHIQEKLAVIQQDQFAAEQSGKLDQFKRDSERQYVALVYNDLVAKEKDAVRQRTALSLLLVLAPETGLKLLAWAQSANKILPENQTESRNIEKRLETLQANTRFRIFLHIGEAKGRPVPELAAIRKALEGEGYSVVAVDSLLDNDGPGVDFFNSQDRTAAENIAKILRELLPRSAAPINARQQSAQNRVGTLGIWF